MKNMSIIFVLLIISSISYSAMPVIERIDDQRAMQGFTYEYQPTLQSGQQTIWVKTFGPDDVTVNPIKGLVSWAIPSDLPSESFHIGIKASNTDGEYEETWIVTVGNGRVIYIGPDEDIKTLKDGMSDMESGDSLVMRNGYWDHNNKLNTIPGNAGKTQTLPAGSITKYSTLMSEDPGEVIIDGKDEEITIAIFGSTKHPDFELNNNGWSGVSEYIAIKGLVLKNSSTEALRVSYAKNIKLINIGVGPSGNGSTAYSNIYIYRSQNVLIEGLFAWGHGRYKVAFQQSSNSVVRRSVARIDNYYGGKPIGGYISYCSKNIIFQNNILIDSDHPEYWMDHNEIINAFGVPATNCYEYPEFNEFKRSLALNVHMGLMNTDARTNTNPSLWEDLVGWDLKPARHGGDGSVTPILSGVGATVTNRMTLGNVNSEGDYLFYSRNLDSIIKNSVMHQINWDGSQVIQQADLVRQGSGGMVTLDSNNITGFLGDDSDGTRSPNVSGRTGISPSIKYITMLPRDSLLREKGLGAELLSMVGSSGTFYGQLNFDEETNIPMWPFPGEAMIQKHFGAFNYEGTDRDGGTAGVNGSRGFAVDGQTLTNYVWGYLGNVVPPFNVKSVNGNEQVKLMWQPSAQTEQDQLSSYKIYDISSGESVLKATVDSGTLSYTVINLENLRNYQFAVTAVKKDGTESDYAYSVLSAPVSKPRPKPPVLSVE